MGAAVGVFGIVNLKSVGKADTFLYENNTGPKTFEMYVGELAAHKEKIAMAEGISRSTVMLVRSTTLFTLIALGLASFASILLGLLLSRSIARPLGQAVDIAGAIAGGDLRSEVDKSYIARRDETWTLAQALSGMVASLRNVVVSFISSSNSVSSGSLEISSTA